MNIILPEPRDEAVGCRLPAAPREITVLQVAEGPLLVERRPSAART